MSSPKSVHRCPRCGVSEPRQSRKRDALCDGCQHTPSNPGYAWTKAVTELRRLAVEPAPELAPVGVPVRVGGVVRWVAA